MRALNSQEISPKSLRDSVGKPKPIFQLFDNHFLLAYNVGALLIVEISLAIFLQTCAKQL